MVSGGLTRPIDSILNNPDRALNFITGEQHTSDRAAEIVTPMYVDACIGG